MRNNMTIAAHTYAAARRGISHIRNIEHISARRNVKAVNAVGICNGGRAPAPPPGPRGPPPPPILKIFPKSTPAAKAPRGLNPSAAITTVTNAPEVISSKSCINVISSFWVPISLLPLYFLLKHPSPLIKLNTTREGVFGHNGYLFFANTFC